MTSTPHAEGDPTTTPGPQGILIAGEGLADALTEEHRAALANVASAMAGGLTVEVSVVTDFDSIPEPALGRAEEWALDLSGKTAEEILDDHRLIYHDDYIDDGTEQAMDEAFLAGLRALPGQNPELAVDAYTALARAPETGPRHTAAVMIHHAVGAGPEPITSVWKELLADADRGVASSASETIEYGVHEDRLTAEQALELMRTYRDAKRERTNRQ